MRNKRICYYYIMYLFSSSLQLGKLLLNDVGLGKTESVIKKDNTRTAPPEGFDSIVVRNYTYILHLVIPHLLC